MAAATGGRVLLRIEDHDRQRSRDAFDVALREDLAWLGLVADHGPMRQTSPDALAAYRDAAERLRAAGRCYGCTCTRATFAAWVREHGGPWVGPGCPGRCASQDLDGPTWRVDLGDGDEPWLDAVRGPSSGPVAPSGDLVIRDRRGNWTYGFAVVVDDHRQDIGIVVRGEDLWSSTPSQVRLGGVLGRVTPAAFVHHPLVRRPDGSKLSKSAGDTAVRELRAAGEPAEAIIGRAATVVGLQRAPLPVSAREVGALVATALADRRE